jgi:hypothetical protein
MKYPMKSFVTKSLATGILCCLCAAAVAMTSAPSVSASSRNAKRASPAARPVATSPVATSPAATSPAATTEEQALLQANGGLVRAFERDDTATIERLLDPDFTWIDPTGIIRSKEEVLLTLPPSATSNSASATKSAASASTSAGASASVSTPKAAPVKAPKPEAGIWSDAKVAAHVYGNGTAGSAGVILVARGKTHILRVWIKRPAGWRLLHINEITQLAQAPAGDAAVPSEAGVATPCINPCKSVPYTPPTPAEQAAFSSWQLMETGSSVRDMDVWGAQVTDDCLIVDSAGSDPLTKADRIARTLKQKQAGVRTNEAVPLLQARMFDFGDTVMMVSEHQPYGGKPYWASRLWTNTNGRYQMFISFHTTIEDVPSFALATQLPDK